jgi:tape measure domain-containing protein
MADLKIKIKGDIANLKAALKDGANKVNGFGNKISKAFGITAKRAFLATAAAIAFVFTKANMLAAAFETTQVSFGVILGSMKEAKSLMSDLTEFSTRTPFTPSELFKATRSLLAFGVAGSDVMKRIKTLGDVSAGTGKDIAELAQIYGKVFVKGKIQAEELNQLSEAGVPIIKELERAYGRTAAEIFKMGSQGKLSFEDLDAAMQAMTTTGGVFFNMMDRQSDTMSGKLSTLKGNVDELGRSLASLEISKGMVERLDALVKLLADTAKTGKDTKFTAENLAIVIEGFFGQTMALEDQQERLGLNKVIGKKELDLARVDREKRRKAEQKALIDAERKKAEAAARLGAAGASKAARLLADPLSISDKFRAQGSNIVGFGGGGMSVQDQQLAKLTEIAEAVRQANMVTTAMQNHALIHRADRRANGAVSKGS